MEQVVHEMVRVAVVYLRLRDRRHSFRYHVSPLTENDLALECIADLFRRDPRGRFVELRRRIDPAAAAMMDPATLFAEVRRMVARKVDDGLFRQLQESDPSLARVIRGLKRAAAASSDTRVVRSRGLLWIRLAEEGGRRRPEIPFEVFEALLCGAATSLRARDLLRNVVETLRALPEFEPRVPIVTAAICLRASIVRGSVPLRESAFEEPEPTDAVRLAAAVVGRPEPRSATGDPDLEAAYRAGAADVVVSSVTPHGGQTHFEALSRHLPGLTPCEYRARHRTRFEYVVRLTRKRFLERARTEIVDGRPRGLSP